MRFIPITILLAIFIALPLYVLNTMVLPELNGLAQNYAHAGATADQVVHQYRTDQ